MSCLCKDAFLLRVIFVSCGDRLLCTVHQVLPGGSGSSLEECTFFFSKALFLCWCVCVHSSFQALKDLKWPTMQGGQKNIFIDFFFLGSPLS